MSLSCHILCYNEKGLSLEIMYKEFLKMKVERINNTRVKYTFDVTPHEFEHGLDHAFNHVQKEVELKGFRKGKVPRNIYEQKFGVESLFEDALNHVLHHKFHDVQNHGAYETVGQPQVDVDIKNVKRGETFEVSIISAVKPEVELKVYKGLEVKAIDGEVTEEELNAEINRMLEQKADLAPKEGNLQEGDVAIFDFEGFLNGEPFEGGKAENYELGIGSKSFIPGFEEQMVGLAPGEEKELHVTFPETYQAKNLAGQAVVFKVKLHEVKQTVKPDLNDAFVESLDKPEYKTVEELKANTLERMSIDKKAHAERDFSNDLMDKLSEANPVEVPEEMLADEMKHYRDNAEQQAKQYGIEFDMFLSLSGVTKEQFEAQIREEASKRVTTTLILEAIAKKENITATKEELDEKYKELAERYSMTVEQIKQHLSDQLLGSDIAVQKAYQLVVDTCVKI